MFNSVVVKLELWVDWTGTLCLADLLGVILLELGLLESLND